MKSIKLLPLFFAALAIFAFTLSCASKEERMIEDALEDAEEINENLVRNMKLFDNQFETRSVTSANLLIQPNSREEFQTRFPEFKKRVTFHNSSTLNIKFLNQGQPIKQSGALPEQKFDEAVVTKRYEIVVLPSNRLKTLVVKHRWVLEKEFGEKNWFVIPDLDGILGRK